MKESGARVTSLAGADLAIIKLGEVAQAAAELGGRGLRARVGYTGTE